MLAIDYGVLRWKKDLTYRVIAKCLRLALDNLVVTQVTKRNPENTAVAADEHEIRKSLTRMFKAANIIPIAPNAKVSQAEADRRRAAEGFIRGGEVLVHSDVVKRALPGHEDQRALRSLNLIRTERPDTATVSKKITGVQGRRRYYAFDLTFYGESVKADPAEANDP